ncbi:MAG TPA: host attachment protein [Phenylobacterium sp.]|nr:host attachment protein [Phenylobacterium sp.]
MDQGGVTWIVTADAVEARIFVERVRSGPVREAAEHRLAATDAERESGRAQRATAHQRTGPGQHASDREPSHEAERRFLKRVATWLGLESSRGAFDRLVLMGPPRALGVLRAALPHGLAAKVETADPHERKRDDAEAVRRHLREARARIKATVE